MRPGLVRVPASSWCGREARPGARHWSRGCGSRCRSAGNGRDTRTSRESPTGPQNALDTLDHVDRTGTAPQGYQGSAPFLNDGRGGGQILSATDAQGNHHLPRMECQPKSARGQPGSTKISDRKRWISLLYR